MEEGSRLHTALNSDNSVLAVTGHFRVVTKRNIPYIILSNYPKWKGATMANKKEALVVGSKVRAFIKSKKCLTSGELITALNNEVMYLLDKACKSAKANKRSTLKAKDL